MNKEQIEIELKSTVNVFNLCRYLKDFKDIKKAYVVTGQRIRVYYDAEKLPAKMLMRLIGDFNRTFSKDNRANVVHIKEVKEDAA